MERRLQSQNDADAAGRDLHPHRNPGGRRGFDPAQDAAPLPRLLIALRQRDRQRMARCGLRHALQDVEFSVEAVGALGHVKV
jgi:hypothetical protein